MVHRLQCLYFGGTPVIKVRVENMHFAKRVAFRQPKLANVVMTVGLGPLRTNGDHKTKLC